MVVGKVYMSTKVQEKIVSWLISSQYWLWPGVCILCRQDTGQPRDLCLACQPLLKPIPLPCIVCGLPLPANAGEICGKCLLQPPVISRSVMRLAWAEPASGLVSLFKYQRKLQHGRVLTDLLAAQLQTCYQNAPWPELLLPVPLHPRKLRQRGYNQSLLMARLLGKTLGLPVATSLVKRVLDTPQQQGLSARERKLNLRNAFLLEQGAQSFLQDVQRIAIVDDVVTTMSTASAIAKLLQAGTSKPLEIHLWALARA
jgi:ComF family protein